MLTFLLLLVAGIPAHASPASFDEDSGDLEVIGLLGSTDPGSIDEVYARTRADRLRLPDSDMQNAVQFDTRLALLAFLNRNEQAMNQHLDSALSLCQLHSARNCTGVLRASAVLEFARGNQPEAESLLRQVIALVDADNLQFTVDDHHLLTRVLVLQGKLSEADQAMERLLDIARTNEANHPLLALDVRKHWLDYFSARGQKPAYKGKTRPGPLLESYRTLGLVHLKEPQARLGLLARYIGLGLKIRHSRSRLVEAIEELMQGLVEAGLTDPNTATMFGLAGEAAIRLHRADLAQIAFEQAVAVSARDNGPGQMLFAQPALLEPATGLGPQPLARQAASTLQGQGLYAEFRFTVDREGRVRQIELVESTASTRATKRARERLQAAIFRPRFVDGELTETTGLRLKIDFPVLEDLPGVN